MMARAAVQAGRIWPFNLRITPDEHKLLKSRSLRLRQSMAEIVRRGLDREIASERRYQSRQQSARIKRPRESGTCGRPRVVRAG